MLLTRITCSGLSALPHVSSLAVLQAVRFEAKHPHHHQIDLRRGLVGPSSDCGKDARISDDLRPNCQPQLLGPDALILEVCGSVDFVALCTLQYCPGANMRPVSLTNPGLC